MIDQPPFLSGPELHAAEQVFGPEIGETEFGLGDLTPEFFFSPRKPIQLGPEASLVWGLGPGFQFPTATDDELGTGKWSAGPGFVVFLSDRALHVTTGFLILNLWSFAGDEDRANVNAMTLSPSSIMNLGGTSVAHAQQGEDLREAAQNPIADLISLPFQNNTNFDIGRSENTQNVLNIQPVYPVHLNQSWNLITRPILPVISQPPFFSGRELAAAEEIFTVG